MSRDAEYIATKEEGDFVQIQVDYELSGYVHKDYITQRVEFDQAVSVEEEKKKKEETEKLQKEAQEAIAAMEQLRKEEGAQNGGTVISPEISSSEIGFIQANPNEEPVSKNPMKPRRARIRVLEASPGLEAAEAAGTLEVPGPIARTAELALEIPEPLAASPVPAGIRTFPRGSWLRPAPEAQSWPLPPGQPLWLMQMQFLGNPYVYGGTSLTEGATAQALR